MIKKKRGQIPEDLKQKALSMLETESIDTVASALRIRKAALIKMIENEAAPTVSISSPASTPTVAMPMEVSASEEATTTEAAVVEEKSEGKAPRYSPEFKATALAMMEEKGAVATIKELGISSYSLYDWKSKADGQKYPRRQGPLAGKTRKRYTSEFKAEVIAFYQSHGAGETREKYGISGNALYTWLEDAGIERVGQRPVDHTDAIAMFKEKGAEAVLEAYGISKATLREWLKDAGIDASLSSPKYSAEFIAAALAMTQEKPLTAVAKELGVPASTLAGWKSNSWRKRDKE